jgi:hypothetical protein
LLAAREAVGRPLPGYVQEEFEAIGNAGGSSTAFRACAAMLGGLATSTVLNLLALRGFVEHASAAHGAPP